MNKSLLTRGNKTSGKFTTATEDIILSFGCMWILVGLSVDGYAHSNILDPGETESFFTLWHAIFYSGFIATASWLGILMYRRREVGKKVLEWIPEGYEFAFYGLIVFAVGGLGDAIWHTIFGIETGLDALLSPTHILLFVGIFMIASSPARAGSIRQGRKPSAKKASFPIHLSVGLIVSLIAFFMSYTWVLVSPRLTVVNLFTDTGLPIVSNSGEQFDTGYYTGELTASLAITGSLMTTAILLASMLYLWGRWELRFGTGACIWGFSTLVAAGVFLVEEPPLADYLVPTAIAFAGGLVFDIAIRLPYRRAVRSFVAVTLSPLVLWSMWSICAVTLLDTHWVAELWGGLLTLNIFVGLAVKFLMESRASSHEMGCR